MTRNRILPYDKKLKTLARQLRKNSTLSEVLLWREIKNKKLGCEFHRQVPIGNYIVDFFCHEMMLALEIDGYSHRLPQAGERDLNRQEELERLGVRFLRFQDAEVRKNLHLVLERISCWVQSHS